MHGGSVLKNNDKNTRIIEAVKENDVDSLRELLDSPQMFKLKDENSTPLLEMAIVRRHKEVFDYLLSLENYPLEIENSHGETALIIALGGFNVLNDYEYDENMYIDEYYALQLLQTGANVDAVSTRGNNLLHLAMERAFISAAKILIDRGVDVNAENLMGETPLHMICSVEGCSKRMTEGVLMLLWYEADPHIRNDSGFTPFDLIMCQHHRKILALQEHLFYYVFDEYTEYEINFVALLKAAQYESPLFYKIIEKTHNVIFNGAVTVNYIYTLFKIAADYLRVIIEKSECIVREILYVALKCVNISYSWERLSVENFYIMIESPLQYECCEWLHEIPMKPWTAAILNVEISESTVQSLICFLLSYGINMQETDLQLIYARFGYCHLLKILLHMCVEMEFKGDSLELLPRLLYDVTGDVQNPSTWKFMTRNQVEDILPYFVISKRQICCFDPLEDTVNKMQNQPQVPLLVELARNVFRRHFVRRLGIRNSRQFYTLLKLLPISSVHRKIITLEVKLY